MELKVGGLYRTRAGEQAKVLELNANPEYPVVALIGGERPVRLRRGGVTRLGATHSDDLVAAWRTPINSTGYINEYATHNGFSKFSRVFPSKEKADRKARATGDNRSAVVKVQITELSVTSL